MHPFRGSVTVKLKRDESSSTPLSRHELRQSFADFALCRHSVRRHNHCAKVPVGTALAIGRTDAERRGDVEPVTNFDLKAWHTTALRLGSIGLAQIEHRARPQVRVRSPGEQSHEFIAHRCGINVHPGPQLDAGDTLVDAHSEAVQGDAAARRSVAQQWSRGRIRDHVGHYQ